MGLPSSCARMGLCSTRSLSSVGCLSKSDARSQTDFFCRNRSRSVIAHVKTASGRWKTCNQYIDCTNGIERLVTCQNHLVFDDSTGDCEHPDAANRDGCTAEELYGFSCPTGVSQSRHAAESDCRA